MGRLEQVISSIDVKKHQVLIEAALIELTLTTVPPAVSLGLAEAGGLT